MCGMKLIIQSQTSTVEVWEWISNIISHFTRHVITYPCWDYSKSHVNKSAPRHTGQWGDTTALWIILIPRSPCDPKVITRSQGQRSWPLDEQWRHMAWGGSRLVTLLKCYPSIKIWRKSVEKRPGSYLQKYMKLKLSITHHNSVAEY